LSETSSLDEILPILSSSNTWWERRFAKNRYAYVQTLDDADEGTPIIITLCPHFIREHNSFTASESYGTFYLTMSFVVKRGEYEDTNDVLQEAPPLLYAPSSFHLASM